MSHKELNSYVTKRNISISPFSSSFFSLKQPEFSVRSQPTLSIEASSFSNDISNQDEVTVIVLGLVLGLLSVAEIYNIL